MKSRISAMMDGELEIHERSQVLEAVSGDESLRQDWSRYALVGDALRGETHLDLDVTAKVMAALHGEPTVLAPRRPVHQSFEPLRRGMAVAAGLAGVSIVAWMAVSAPEVNSPVPVTAPVAARKPEAVLAKATPQAPSRRMREYLVAHQTYALAGQMQGGTRYVRTVAAER